MSRRLPEELKGKDLTPLCIASRPDEAQKIESALDSATVDYTFEITTIAPTSFLSIIFASIKEGVMFLVPSDQFEFCIKILEDAGLAHLIIDI